jgi:hypothetical protein
VSTASSMHLSEPMTENEFRYILLNPLFRLLTKSPKAALQCTLHALFLPTPFKYLESTSEDPRKRSPEEVLKPGALYAECAVVPVRMPAPSMSPAEDQKRSEGGKETKAPNDDAAVPDDGELGGVKLGMQVWDDYERELKIWEAAQPQPTDAGKAESNAETAARTASTD